MSFLDKVAYPSKKRNKRLLWILAPILLLAVIISITVPIVMSRKGAASALPVPPTVLVPLYIYPAEHAWDPLYSALSSHPTLNFTLIVNPSSGPGGPIPDGNYTRELTKLASFPNARMVGYVSTVWARRNLTDVMRDVQTYKQWNASYAMKGIFFDETPNEYDPASASFLTSVNALVRNPVRGLGPGALVIHNPGTNPDARYMGSAGPDLAVVIEATYDTFKQHGVADVLASQYSNSTRLASMVHSIPADLSSQDMSDFVKQLKGLTSNVFVTDLDTDVYSSWSSTWSEFVKDMAA